jgi:hypothetical protein
VAAPKFPFKIRTRVRRARDNARSRSVVESRVDRLEAARKELSARVSVLEEAVQELRGLGGRVSELADVVTELLAVEATRADPEFQRLVDQYRRGI